MRRKSNIAIAEKAGIAMLIKAIEVIGEEAGHNVSTDRGNMLLCMALGVVLNQSRNIDENIARLSAETFLDMMTERTVQ